MHNFLYGSRVIEDERTVSIETNMMKAGNIIGNIVKSFVMFFIFVLFNILLNNVLEHCSTLASVNTIRVLEEGIYLLSNDNSLSILYFVYRHMFGVLLAILGGVSVCFAVVCMCGTVFIDEMKQGGQHFRSCFMQISESRFAAVSYKQKVSFLS